MRILALVTSYRKQGNTARFVQMIEAAMQALAARDGVPLEFETVNLGHLDLQTCRGCRACFDRGEDKCPLADDLRAVRAQMDAADGIVLASPVYVDDVNAIAKNWMDRLAYVCHRPAFAGKCAYLVATVGSSMTGHTLRTMNGAMRTWGFAVVGQMGLKMGALATDAEMASRFRAKAGSAAQALFGAVSEKRALRPSFVSLMIFAIQQHAWRKAAPDSLDYRYWAEHGWLEGGRQFYVEHGAAPVKAALARLVGAIAAPFLT